MTGTTYQLQSSDLGNTVVVNVNATGTNGQSIKLASNVSAAVDNPTTDANTVLSCSFTPDTVNIAYNGTGYFSNTTTGGSSAWITETFNGQTMGGAQALTPGSGNLTWSSLESVMGPTGGTVTFNFYELAASDNAPYGSSLCSLTLNLAPTPPQTRVAPSLRRLRRLLLRTRVTD